MHPLQKIDLMRFYDTLLKSFSLKITSHKDHLEVCLTISILLSGLSKMWSSMKISLIFRLVILESVLTSKIQRRNYVMKIAMLDSLLQNCLNN